MSNLYNLLNIPFKSNVWYRYKDNGNCFKFYMETELAGMVDYLIVEEKPYKIRAYLSEMLEFQSEEFEEVENQKMMDILYERN